MYVLIVCNNCILVGKPGPVKSEPIVFYQCGLPFKPLAHIMLIAGVIFFRLKKWSSLESCSRFFYIPWTFL